MSAGRKLNKQSARHPVDDRGQSCAGSGLSRRSLTAYDSSGHDRTRVSLNKVGPEYATRTNAPLETSKGTTREKMCDAKRTRNREVNTTRFFVRFILCSAVGNRKRYAFGPK